MPRYVLTQLTAGMLRTLGDGLDIIDVGIVLLNRDLRAVYINQKFWEIWRIDPDRFAPGPTFRDLLDYVTISKSLDLPEADLPIYVAEQEEQVRAGSVRLTRIGLAGSRYVLFRCVAAGDGGRLLTYIDISKEIEQAASDATDRASAELRFNTETLESQAAYLASLAEATEENAQKAEAARVLLEKEIAERRQLEVKLREMATTDGLTGALNRSEFLASAQYLLGLGTRWRC